jgi:hypothetical protein
VDHTQRQQLPTPYPLVRINHRRHCFGFGYLRSTKLIAQITDVTFRHYRDNDSFKVCVSWKDRCGQSGRTEGNFFPEATDQPMGDHMTALVNRAGREGVTIHGETW